MLINIEVQKEKGNFPSTCLPCSQVTLGKFPDIPLVVQMCVHILYTNHIIVHTYVIGHLYQTSTYS